MASGFHWIAPPDVVFPQMARAYATALHNGVLALAQSYKPQIENWMKDNAPWMDRTANARQTLYVEIENVVYQMVRIILSHGVYYGWYLEGINPATMTEMKNAGRWSIVNPALDHFGPKIWADVLKMVVK